MTPVLRSPSPEEAPAIHALMSGIQRADGLPMQASLGEVEEMFDSPDLDPVDDMRVLELDGALIGYAMVEHSVSGVRLERAFLPGGVHPDHRGQGYGRQLLSWQNQRADEKLAATDTTLPAYALTWLYEIETTTMGFLEAHGYQRARYEHELLRSLAEIPPVPTIDGVTIRPWTDADTEPARLVFNASFADHWGSTPRQPDSWAHMVVSDGARLDVSFVAVDTTTDEVVGIAFNGHYPEDQEITGRLDGWVHSLGTLRSHRKRGIASALIIASFHAFLAAGFDHAMLGVDTENPTGAYGIYESLGFERVHTLVTMRRTVREGSVRADG